MHSDRAAQHSANAPSLYHRDFRFEIRLQLQPTLLIILLCNSTATLSQCDRHRDAVSHHTSSIPSNNIFPSYRNKCFVCPFMNNSGIRYKTANVAIRDVVRKLYQGVLYFQHVTVLHGTRVNIILCMSKKLRPSLRSFSRNSQTLNTVLGHQTSSSRIMWPSCGLKLAALK